MPAATSATEPVSTDPNAGKLVVLTDGFVARTDNKEGRNPDTKRYGQGEFFSPVEGIHDVESLIARKILGRVGDGKLKRSTALDLAHASARINQEDSPVLDLSSQPFAPTVPADSDVDTSA